MERRRGPRHQALMVIMMWTLDATAGCQASPSDERDDVRTPSATLVIEAPQARACDLVIRGEQLAGTAVVFNEGVRGELLLRSPRLALSLVARSDVDIRGAVATLTDASETAAWAQGLAVESIACHGRDGRALADARAVLE